MHQYQKRQDGTLDRRYGGIRFQKYGQAQNGDKCLPDCHLAKFPSWVQTHTKQGWLETFKRQDANPINCMITKQSLCPRKQYPDLTLQGDPEIFKMYPWECGKGMCSECGQYKSLCWNCPVFMNNEEKIEVRTWEKQACSTGVDQQEIVVKEMEVHEVMAMLREQLHDCIKHKMGKTWKNRMRGIDIRTFNRSTISICTDFSAMMDLHPTKTKCSHVDRHAVIAIFYVFSNPRWVTTESGTAVRVTDCDVWHIFGDTLNKNTKNDHFFHNAALNNILKHYIEEKRLPIKNVHLWTNNCPTQYWCHQNFFTMSQIPIIFLDMQLIEHCFAQVYSFKGSWDAAGKVIKDYIHKLEKLEMECIQHAFHCHLHADQYFKEHLPNGNDWIALKATHSDKLLLKMPFNAVNCHSCYATENKAEYDWLMAEGHKGIIYIDCKGAANTTVYKDCTSGNHFSADGTVAADGSVQLKMKPEFCCCTCC